MIAMEAEGSLQGFLKKKFIPLITLIAAVAGLFMLVAGIVVRVIEEKYAAISSVPIHTGPILLLLAGIVSLLVALLGIYIIKKQALDDMWKVIVFLVLLALAALLALVGGGLAVRHQGKVKDTFEKDLQEKIEMYGRTGYETIYNVNRLQEKDKCCGVYTYADWRVTVFGGHRYDTVPDSCCKEPKNGCGFKFKDEEILYKEGCASIALDKMNKNLMVVSAGGILSGIFEAILCISFCWLYHRYRKSHNQSIPHLKAEYRKTDTASSEHDDDGSGSRGGDTAGAHGGGTLGTEGTEGHYTHSAQGETFGGKAVLPPIKSKTN